MTQTAIMKLVADSIIAALEAQAANMANTDNTTRPREAPVARTLFSSSNCTKDYKVKFATGTLTKEALSWWNSFAQPIGIEEAYKITWAASKPQTLEEAINIAQRLMDQYYYTSLYKASLFGSIDGSGFKDDDVLLTRSLLAVPITGSLVIEARLTDLDSGDYILRGSRVFDSHCNGIFKVDIKYNDCTLKVQVTWSQD
ncbi:hypothetical protein Tco_0303879 [Tanacetum coccineum]